MTAYSPSLVSVIIPSYNHIRFIEHAMDSVFRQTHPEIELIVVDDASRDGSADAIRAWVEKPGFRKRFHNRVIVECFVQNKGAHDALNRGLDLASGDFIAILNSDDKYHPRRLEKMLQSLIPHGPMGFAFSRIQFVNADGDDVSARTPFTVNLIIAQDSIDNFPSTGFALLKQQIAISTGNLLGSRKLFDRVGYFSSLKYCHDWNYILRCLCVTEPVYVAETLYDYRIHGDNTFRTLASVAHLETDIVIRQYFDSIRFGDVQNPLGPTAFNWPGIFEMYLKRFGYERLWYSP